MYSISYTIIIIYYLLCIASNVFLPLLQLTGAELRQQTYINTWGTANLHCIEMFLDSDFLNFILFLIILIIITTIIIILFVCGGGGGGGGWGVVLHSHNLCSASPRCPVVSNAHPDSQETKTLF